MKVSVDLFGDNGFEATSMRCIADAAGVNLAATNYHFGSKAQLFEETFNYCVAPLNDERVRRLDALEADPEVLTIESIVRAFVDPGIALEGRAELARLVARIFVEPKTLSRPLLEQAFAPTVERFFSALRRVLPGVEPRQIEWRFHFLIGAMLQFTRFEEPLNVFGSGSSNSDSPGQGLEELVRFVTAGLCQDCRKTVTEGVTQ
ncbi:TetR/AcrR family transcriptional regulator [Eudoraea sp.]|uniref:TetR/AcrR family transcriptional regulator n=1 Tax=Eudoraea sp. TaxID=1979955 RepID=UPI003C7819A9